MAVQDSARTVLLGLITPANIAKGFAVGGLIAVAAFTATHLPDAGFGLSWLLCLALLFAIGLGVRLLSNGHRMQWLFSPAGLTIVYSALSVALVPILWTLGLAEPWVEFPVERTGLVVATALVGIVALSAGAKAASGRFEPRRIAFDFDARGIDLVLAFGVIAGIVAIATLAVLTGGLTALLADIINRRELLAGVGPLGVLAAICGASALLPILAADSHRRHYIVALVCAVLYVTYLFVNGSRFPMIGYVLAIFAARAHRATVRPRSLLLVAALAVPFSVWYSVTVRRGQVIEDAAAESGLLVRSLAPIIDPFVEGGVDVIRTVAAVATQDAELFAFRINTLIGGMATVVPRTLWPGKPDGSSIGFSAEFFAQQWARGTGVPPSLLAESVFIFGLALAPLALFVVGLTLGRLTVSFWLSSSFLVRLCAAFLTSDFLVLAKSGTDAFFRTGTIHILAAAIVWLAYRTIAQEPRHREVSV